MVGRWFGAFGGVEYDKTAWSHNTEICPMLVLFLVIRDQYSIANGDIDDLVISEWWWNEKLAMLAVCHISVCQRKSTSTTGGLVVILAKEQFPTQFPGNSRSNK